MPRQSRQITRVSDLTRCPLRESNNEPVPVRHLNLRKRVGIHHVVFFDDSVQSQKVRGQCIHLIVRKRSRGQPGHRSTRIVEYRRRIGPEVAYSLRRVNAVGERLSPGKREADPTFGINAVAGGTLLCVDRGT